MTEMDIERLEQAARSVFGHDDGDTPLRPVDTLLPLGDRIRSFLQRRLAPRPIAPGL